MLRTGVGKRCVEFVEAQFFDPEQRDTDSDWWSHVQHLKSLIGNPMLVGVLGPRGRGKTTLSAMIAGCFVWKNKSVIYTTSMEMISEIRDGFKDFGSHNQVKKFQRPDLLIIDEQNRTDKVGQMDEWSMRTLERIVDKRYANNLDTIIISNAREDLFHKHVGDSIKDRIRESGGCIIVNGENFRERGDS